MKLAKRWLLAPLALAAAVASAPVHATANNTAAANWRLDPNAAFNGVANAFNGTALLSIGYRGETATYACSGSLLPGGGWILTAAHCADSMFKMTVQFGWYGGTALETRTAVGYELHPGWIATGGELDTGADLALVKLNAPVTTLNTYYMSTTNDVGKEYLITGYGTTGLGSATSAPGWNDSNYGHYGYNVVDTTSEIFETAWHAATGENYLPSVIHGVTYVSDYDFYNGTSAQQTQYNTLQRIADRTGGGWTSDQGLGLNEALIAGGDSGGGDFIWDAASGSWLLSAVHSWGWEFCQGEFGSGTVGGGLSCDYRTNNDSSFGDLSGSTAVFQHIAWIEATIGHAVTLAVPEPQSLALMLLGLTAVGGHLRRRRAVR